MPHSLIISKFTADQNTESSSPTKQSTPSKPTTTSTSSRTAKQEHSRILMIKHHERWGQIAGHETRVSDMEEAFPERRRNINIREETVQY